MAKIRLSDLSLMQRSELLHEATEQLRREPFGYPEIMTANEVAEFLRVSPRMVTAMAGRNEIPGAFRLASYWRFRRDEILRLYASPEQPR